MIRFKDRSDAGRQLATKLQPYQHTPVIIIGLARGGIATAAAIAETFHAPLDVMVVRKLGAPNNQELAIGAVNAEGKAVVDTELTNALGIPQAYVTTAIAREQQECLERIALYRAHYAEIAMHNKTVILVDDGIATGASMEMAIKTAYAQGAKMVIVATPVVPKHKVARFQALADAVVYVIAPDDLTAVGEYYKHFPQLTHQEVIALLQNNGRATT